VGRHEVAALARAEHDLQEVAAVEPQDGAPVGADVADPSQALREAPGNVEVRGVDHVVDLARAPVTLVDGRDLHLEHEADVGRRPGCEPLVDLALGLVREPKQPRLGGQELRLDLLEPAGVGEVARGHHGDPLLRRPQGQMLQVAVAAGRPRELRVDVQVGVEHRPGPPFPPSNRRLACRPRRTGGSPVPTPCCPHCRTDCPIRPVWRERKRGPGLFCRQNRPGPFSS